MHFAGLQRESKLKHLPFRQNPNLAPGKLSRPIRWLSFVRCSAIFVSVLTPFRVKGNSFICTARECPSFSEVKRYCYCLCTLSTFCHLSKCQWMQPVRIRRIFSFDIFNFAEFSFRYPAWNVIELSICKTISIQNICIGFIKFGSMESWKQPNDRTYCTGLDALIECIMFPDRQRVDASGTTNYEWIVLSLVGFELHLEIRRSFMSMLGREDFNNFSAINQA